MSRSSLTAWLVLAMLVPALASGAPDTPKPGIDSLLVREEPDRVLVSYRLTHCLRDETVERIESGIAIRFRHKIEINERRSGLFVGDRTYARTVIVTKVQYDSLTGRYELTRTTQMKNRRSQPEAEPLEERLQSTSEDEMRRWLTEVVDAPLFVPDGDDSVEYQARIEVSLGRKWLLLIIPTSHTIHLEAPAGLSR